MPENPADFGPRDPIQGVYECDHPSILVERVLYAFQSVLMTPKLVIGRDFTKYVRDLLDEHHPNLRCSAARAVLEGRIPGVPKPVHEIHPNSAKRIQQALCLLDVFETIVHQEQGRPKQDDKAIPDPEPRSQRKRITRTVRTRRAKVERAKRRARVAEARTSSQERNTVPVP